jgi:hypothetical protein
MKSALIGFVGLLQTVIVATSAIGQSPSGLPYFDPDRHCKRQTSIMGGGSFWMKACLEQEQDAYDQLKASWPTLEAGVKRQCQQQASIMGASYFWLNLCVVQELDSRDAVEGFKFRR